jgi:hypothetical protein
MRLAKRANVISVISIASLVLAAQSEPRPTDVGATTAQPKTAAICGRSRRGTKPDEEKSKVKLALYEQT